jgi:hypothetical protein
MKKPVQQGRSGLISLQSRNLRFRPYVSRFMNFKSDARTPQEGFYNILSVNRERVQPHG